MDVFRIVGFSFDGGFRSGGDRLLIVVALVFNCGQRFF